jgi:uncharacterized membrane-anchored protein
MRNDAVEVVVVVVVVVVVFAWLAGVPGHRLLRSSA